MELKEEMYVRTKNGNIGEITFISSLDNLINLDTESYSIGKHFILKVSHNIIDLIEVGDYVNGYLVTDVYRPDGNEVFRIEIERDTLKGHIIDKSSQIKSVVTHEQFESMAYKVGED